MRKKRSRLVLLVIAVLVIIIIGTVIWVNLGNQSPRVAIGVKPGDTFTYELQGLWESDDPNATISNIITQLNMTDWYRITVTNVSYPDVSVHAIWRFENGTEIEADGKVDVETGLTSGGFWAIYAANLNEGDKGHAYGPEPAPISGTVNKQYSSGKRETNQAVLSAQYQNKEDPTRFYTETRVIQFDRKTGMLVELRDESSYNIPEMTETIVWRLSDSNVWDVA